MKNLVALLIILIFSGVCLAQNSSSSATEEITVVFASYTKAVDRKPQTTYVYVPYVERADNSTGYNSAPFDTIRYVKLPGSTPSGSSQNRTSVQFKNNTQKKVTSIEYNFIFQKKSGKVIKKYSLLNNSDINAGETKILSDVIGYTNGPITKAEIIRVTYKDGSVWVP